MENFLKDEKPIKNTDVIGENEDVETFHYMGMEQNVLFFIHKQINPDYDPQIAYNLFNCMIVHNRIPNNHLGKECKIIVYDVNEDTVEGGIVVRIIQHMDCQKMIVISRDELVKQLLQLFKVDRKNCKGLAYVYFYKSKEMREGNYTFDTKIMDMKCPNIYSIDYARVKEHTAPYDYRTIDGESVNEMKGDSVN